MNLSTHREAAWRVLALMLTSLCFDVDARAMPSCIDYDDYLHRIGGLETAGDSRDVAVSGTVAFVADGNPGSVAVVDVATPTAPSLLTTLINPGVAIAVTVAGDRLFVALGDWGVRVFDITDPASPTFVGNVSTPGIAVDVAASSTIVLIADRNGGLQLVDRNSLALIGNLPLPANSVVAINDRAYVVDTFSTLHIVDISDATEPLVLGSVSENGATRVTVQDSWAYVSGQSWGLHIVDLSDETQPVIVATAPVNAYDVSIKGRYALVAGPRVTTVDLTDPYDPVVVGGATTPGTPESIALEGDLAFVATGLYGGVQILDVSNPTSPESIAEVAFPDEARDVDQAGEYAYVAAGSSGLQIVDVSVPTMPEPVSAVPIENWADAVVVQGDYAYVSAGFGGLKIVDVEPPNEAAVVGEYNGPSDIIEVALSGERAIVIDYSPGIKIVDVADVANPTFLGGLTLPGPVRGVAVSGDHAFVVGDNGLFVVDISNSESPSVVGTLQALTTASDIAIAEPYAYITRSNSSPQVGVLVVVDISSPTSPQAVGAAAVLEVFVGEIGLRNQFAFVANGFLAGFHVFDMSRPRAPELIGTIPTSSAAFGVAASGAAVLIADGNAGLSLFAPQCLHRREFVPVTPDDLSKNMSLGPGLGLSAAPNPFSDEVRIQFTLSSQASGDLCVFDAAGRRVRTFRAGPTSGVQTVSWDGRDDSGARLSSGIYLVRMGHGSTVSESRVVLLR